MAFDSTRIVSGHRGAAGLAPENTLASFQAAAELGVHAVELDVQWHAGALWVVHDATLDRTTDARGALIDFSYAQLRAVDAGNGARIPLLGEVMDALPPAVGINIELKGSGTAQPVARAVGDFADRDLLVSSFDHTELARFARLDHCGCRIAPLWDRWRRKMWDVARELGAWSVNLNWRLATDARLARASAEGYRVCVYTVNDTRHARALFAAGVTGIFTDRPDLLMPAVRGDRSP
jgi:glycerophosphoryl diester phosphodiesterase